MIDRFTEYYYFLSNFYPHKMTYPTPNSKGGSWLRSWASEEFRTSEHAYQAYKSDNLAEHEYIKNLDTAGKAKRAGANVITMRKNWEEIKYDVMLDIVRAKFEDEELAKNLLDTRNEILVESNYWHDCIWGSCTCDNCRNKEKLNWLGKILMQVREEIKNDRERYNIFKY
jgi:ribA/ribD-fused uncharacterized protein